MTQTPHYKLTQWDKSDRILMEPFNQDHVKIDTALKAHDTAIAAKAQQSDLTAEISARTGAISALNTAVAKLGNCQLYATTYTGSGAGRAENPRSFAFPHPPRMVILTNGTAAYWWILGRNYSANSINPDPRSNIGFQLSGNTLSWWSTNSTGLTMDNSGETYSLLALLAMS
ncbi:MAG: hypothetical protein HFG12_02990 [Oscillibacter sp.]|mgnify:FL=1|nr:hypothetical protein [uncultured Oscillibacter sp.]MCI8812193.1 hypothetical protein [Oscillibacter sp.]